MHQDADVAHAAAGHEEITRDREREDAVGFAARQAGVLSRHTRLVFSGPFNLESLNQRHRRQRHNYMGHNYTGHKYIGHNYIGHSPSVDVDIEGSAVLVWPI